MRSALQVMKWTAGTPSATALSGAGAEGDKVELQDLLNEEVDLVLVGAGQRQVPEVGDLDAWRDGVAVGDGRVTDLVLRGKGGGEADGEWKSCRWVGERDREDDEE